MMTRWVTIRLSSCGWSVGSKRAPNITLREAVVEQGVASEDRDDQRRVKLPGSDVAKLQSVLLVGTSS